MYQDLRLPSLPGCEFLSLDDRKYLKTIVALARVLAPNSTSPLARSFGPYLATLPTLASYRAFYPRYMRAPLRADFGGLPLVVSTERLQGEDALLHVCFDAWSASGAPATAGLSWEHMQRAIAVFETRRFGLPSPWALVPGADLANTAPIERANTDFWYDKERREFVVETTSQIAAGDEVYVRYLPRGFTNARLVAECGGHVQT